MRKKIAVIVTSCLCTGCAATAEYWRGALGKPHDTPLVRGIGALEAGHPAAAARILRKASEGRPVPGETDEVLFRLALLSLRPNRQAPVSSRARHLLARLKREYPASPWTAQAAQLGELIRLVDELSRQNGELRAAKDSLARKVQELSESIEQSRNLEVELEKAR